MCVMIYAVVYIYCLLYEFRCNVSSNTATAQAAQAWQGIPRNEIDWHPSIVPDKCVGCGLCVTSCGRGVYAFDFDVNKPVVVAPSMCMVGCTSCATNCIEDAIVFPPRAQIRDLIRHRKVLRHAKDLLRDNRDKYDVLALKVRKGD